MLKKLNERLRSSHYSRQEKARIQQKAEQARSLREDAYIFSSNFRLDSDDSFDRKENPRSQREEFFKDARKEIARNMERIHRGRMSYEDERHPIRHERLKRHTYDNNSNEEWS
eukprot:TRINITY_DN2123_c0_g2_i10.p2 TRINITY_DN2123_c0_g2~~TRINITY_DN2123_c0_g2_i10.p2  ORF type:complete len:113 (-),score=22.99 TRINITY_DN2123_c0_g2_i10:233-571(-)